MRRRLVIVPVIVSVIVSAASALAACSTSGGGSTAPTGPVPSATRATPTTSPTARSSPLAPSSAVTTRAATSATSATTATSATAASSAAPDPAALAARKIRTRTAYLGAGGVSVEAVNLDDGSTFGYGARRGMACGSIAKLYIMEVLLLQHQDSDDDLSDDERDLARRAIENSDNAASDQLFRIIGEGAGLTRAAARLGVRHTVPGPGILWGFTLTSAPDYVALLRNLVTPSALSAGNRKYLLGLMADVQAGQRWGVSAAADDDTTVRLKNGWLPSGLDGGRWLVNSVGIVTVHGHRVLLAVLTQHGASFEGGIDLVERIATLAAQVVAPA